MIPEAQIDALAAFIEELVFLSKSVEAQRPNQGLDLSFQEMQVVVALGRAGPRRMTDLAQSIGASVSNTTPVVERLVTKGVAARHRTESDRRVVMVGLTEAGQKELGNSREAKRRMGQKLLAPLNNQERAQLLKLIGRIGEQLAGRR